MYFYNQENAKMKKYVVHIDKKEQLKLIMNEVIDKFSVYSHIKDDSRVFNKKILKNIKYGRVENIKYNLNIYNNSSLIEFDIYYYPRLAIIISNILDNNFDHLDELYDTNVDEDLKSYYEKVKKLISLKCVTEIDMNSLIKKCDEVQKINIDETKISKRR